MDSTRRAEPVSLPADPLASEHVAAPGLAQWPETGVNRLTRRRFLHLLAAGSVLALAGCSAAPASARTSAAPTPTVAATLPFPNRRPSPPTPTSEPVPAARSGLSAPALGEGVASPVPPRPLAYTYRTLPPERLIIPAIELDTPVVPLGTKYEKGSLVWETAAFAVGHHRGSPNPGEAGNVVFSGHVSSTREGAVFKRLPQVKEHDGIVVVTAQGQYLYRVRDIRVVLPAAVEFIEPTTGSILTLITCVPDGVYTHRLIVRAEPI
ncbi:MAG: sortase [Chloroflexi bacterium]|nr:sortase [Chloroflexota bacterium]